MKNGEIGRPDGDAWQVCIFFAERPWVPASEPGRMKLVSELKVQTLGFCSELLSILQQFKE